MSEKGLKIDVRRRRILEILSRDGQVDINRLSRQLGATTVTIRSDLNALEADGYLERFHGGAVQSVQNYQHTQFLRRRKDNLPIKKRIARLAAAMIPDGATLMINSGTTAYETAMALKWHKNLNIVTNSLMAASELGAHPSFRVIMLGGDINTEYAFTYGADAENQLRRYRADYALLSVSGLHVRRGITTYHAQEAMLDRLMMERSGKTIIVADHSKLGNEGFSHVSDLQRKQILVTDMLADPAYLTQLSAEGLEILTDDESAV